jgi:hypothetical protein
MPTKDDLIEAEAKMNTAETDLARYVESKQCDPALVAFLIRKVDEAIAEYERIRAGQR